MYQGLHMDIFIRELKTLLNSLVVKRNVLAKKYETVEILQEAEMYVMVKDGIDDFSSYNNFDFDVYRRAGVMQEDIYKYMQDKNLIPYGLRDALIKLQREYILSRYVEKNNYYRMLNGKPNVEDTDFIYAPENDYGVPTTIPIHQLSENSIEKLRSAGLLADIMTNNPTKTYLKFLGRYSIDVYTARKALNYELLYNEVTDPDNIALNFRKYYANAREYYMNAIYNNNTANGYLYYDNFIGLCILIMAVQRLFASVFEQGITRDFYDVQLVRYLFDSYSIPFIEDMTLDQMKLLAKNLNIFLAYKSSNRVIFDLCSIFGFTNVKIYKYLLVRDHVRDSETGKPIFPVKTISNGDGTFSEVPDYEKMYNIYFQKVDVRTKDVNAALVDKANAVDYTQMTVGDIYWVDDEELRERLYTAGLNHIESKYLSMDILFKITEMMYEISHTFRMIIDNNSEFKKVYLSIPKVSTRPQDLYSIVIWLCAMFCKRYGFTGEIPLKPASIAYVYGFNFHTDLEKICENILDSKYLDDELVKYLLNFQVNTNKDVDRIYHNIKAFKDFIVEQMASTKDIEVYRAYKALYNSVLVVEDKEEMYKKNDGSYAETYFELLENINPELYAHVNDFDTTDKKNTDAIMQHVLYRMETLCSKFKYLHTAVDASALIQVLIRLINFFKSYTVDLAHSGILYLFDDRFFNMLKILDGLNGVDIEAWQDDGFMKQYYDAIAGVDIDFPEGARIKLTDEWFAMVKARVWDKIFLGDDLLIKVLNPVSSRMLDQYADNTTIQVVNTPTDRIDLIDQISDFFVKMAIDIPLHIMDEVFVKILSKYKTEMLGQYADSQMTSVVHKDNENIPIDLRIEDIFVRIFEDVDMRLKEKMTAEILWKLKEDSNLQTADTHTMELVMTTFSNLVFKGNLADMITRYLFESKILLKDVEFSYIKKDLTTIVNTQDVVESSLKDFVQDNQEFYDKLFDLVMRFLFETHFINRDEVVSTIIWEPHSTQLFSKYNESLQSFSKHLIGATIKYIEDASLDIISPMDSRINLRDEMKIISSSDGI